MVLRRSVPGRQRALDIAGAAGAGRRVAAGCSPRGLRPGPVPVDLGGVHRRLFFPVRLQAHALHTARHAGLDAAHLRPTRAAAEARFSHHGRTDPGRRLGAGSGEPEVAECRLCVGSQPLLPAAGKTGGGDRGVARAVGRLCAPAPQGRRNASRSISRRGLVPGVVAADPRRGPGRAHLLRRGSRGRASGRRARCAAVQRRYLRSISDLLFAPNRHVGGVSWRTGLWTAQGARRRDCRCGGVPAPLVHANPRLRGDGETDVR